MCETLSMSNKQNAIDKWRTRVYRESNENHSTQKRLEKQIAILRVAFPFLTDSQIRGRAWYHCGFNSIMGDMPRSGLTPEIKKEFSKRKSPFKRMGRKSKVQRKIIKEKSNDQSPNGSSYNLDPPTGHDPENNFSPNNKGENDFLKGSYTPMSGVNILSDVGNEILKKGTKRKRKSNNSDVVKRIKVTDKVVEETPASSLGSGVKTFYCSQNLYESVHHCDPNIMQTIHPSVSKNTSCYTETKISQSTVIQTIDDSRTVSGLDDTQFTGSQRMFSQEGFSDNAMNLEHNDGLTKSQAYVMSQLYNSQKQLSQQNESANTKNQEYIMSQLYDSHHFATQNQQSSSKVLDLSTAPVSNSTSNSITQSPKSINGSPVNILQNTSGLDEVELQTSNNKSQSFNLDQSTPVKRTDMNEVRKKLSFGTLAEMYHNGTFVVKDNLSGRFGNNENFHEQNCSPQSVAGSSIRYSMINNPPTEFVVQGAPNIIFNQEKLYNEQMNTDTSEFNTTVFDSQKFFEPFPTTPEDTNPLVLPPTLLLSNYCSEYDKAYTMKDLKPNQYRNYRHNESLRSLKEHLDSIIPPDQSLKEFYKIKNLP